MGGIRGIFGRPFIDLESHVDVGAFAALHDEICLALTQVPVDYTGGSHRSMGIMPPSRRDEAGIDYGEVIAAMRDAEVRTFLGLADASHGEVPASLAIEDARRLAGDFGEERTRALSRRQMLWLERRFGVYFPWKAYVELIPNRYWGEKSDASGKDFTRQARAFFPKTIAFAKSLPFVHIGRCNVMGLAANDHGTVHRDGDPADDSAPDHFITVCPAGNKRLFLWDEEKKESVHVGARAYWFFDHDYHGVAADPFFRYSVRVDGVFRPDFLDTLRASHAT